MIIVDLGRIAVYCIKKDEVVTIPKTKGLNFHIEYYIELAHEDPFFEKVLNKFDVQELLDNPSDVQNTVNKELMKVGEGNCLILSMVPQIPESTNLFFALMPDHLNSFQREELNKLVSLPYEFFDFGIFNTVLDDFESLLQDEDYNHENFYLIQKYIDKVQSNKLD